MGIKKGMLEGRVSETSKWMMSSNEACSCEFDEYIQKDMMDMRQFYSEGSDGEAANVSEDWKD